MNLWKKNKFQAVVGHHSTAIAPMKARAAMCAMNAESHVMRCAGYVAELAKLKKWAMVTILNTT